MAICKCGAKLRGSHGGSGRIQQCIGCGRQWPCVKYQAVEDNEQEPDILKGVVSGQHSQQQLKE